MQYIIDRMEGSLAVCERGDGGVVHIGISLLPAGAREGSVLVCHGGAWALDRQAEEARRARLFKMQEALFQ